MNKRNFSLFFIITSFCFAFSFSDYENRISEYTLSNGMRFILLEDHTAPVVSFVVCVDTGSVDEKEGETGISHIIEHLAFNGTEKVGTKNWKKEKRLLEEMDRLYEKILTLSSSTVSSPHMRGEELGGGGKHDKCLTLTRTLSPQGRGKEEERIKILQEKFNKLKEKASALGEPNEFGKILDKHGAEGPNAYTSTDITVYWVDLPSNKVELWALLESDRLFNPVFRSFYEELDIVKEERMMRTENSPWGKLMEEFHKTAFTVHPYRNPVIGYREDLERMTREKVRNFYKRHYVPSNITVVIAGDIEKGEIISLVEKYFGKIPSGKKPERDIPSEPPLEGIRRITVNMDSEPIFITAFQIPDVNHPDIYTLDVLAEILGGGRTSRLYKRLVKEEKIAVSVGVWCRSSKYPSLFYIWAIPAKGRTNSEVENVILEEMEKIKKEGITEKELEGAKARLSMEVLTELKHRRGLAEELGHYYVLTGDWRNLFRYIENTEKVSSDDINRAMERYIDTERRVVGTVEKK
ncbi:MAG: insulinase family protein [bacterium]|nr:insulinase family protein [bacterium]